MGRQKTYKILLSDEDKKLLQNTIYNKKTCKTTTRRCSILLELDDNTSKHLTQLQIAKLYGVSKATVSNIVKSYAEGGIPAITKIKRNPRSNAKRKIDDRMEAELIRIACSPAPDGRSRWTLRLLQKQIKLELDESIDKETIRRALKKMNFDLI